MPAIDYGVPCQPDNNGRHGEVDVVVVGAGTAGIYAALVLKRGIPTDAPKSMRVLLVDRASAGGWRDSGTSLSRSDGPFRDRGS